MNNDDWSLADLADVFVCVEKMDLETLEKVGDAVNRIRTQKREQEGMNQRPERSAAPTSSTRMEVSK
jgi:hypothetical protein